MGTEMIETTKERERQFLASEILRSRGSVSGEQDAQELRRGAEEEPHADHPLLQPGPHALGSLGILMTHTTCPGCKVAHLSVDGAPPSYKELSLVAIIMVCNALPISFIYPFLYFMVRDMGVAKREEDLGFYAGCIGSAFMFGRFCTSMIWGAIADKQGRKPVLLVGLFSVVVFNVGFGVSQTFWTAFFARFLLGSFNGILGTVKAYTSEICSAEHQSLGISVVSCIKETGPYAGADKDVHVVLVLTNVGTTLGVSMVLGPSLGGYLAQPSLKYPKSFPPGSLFDLYPFLLPCVFCSGISLAAFVMVVFCLPETLHTHNKTPDKRASSFQDDITEEQALEGGQLDKEKEGDSNLGQQEAGKSVTQILGNWSLVSAVLVYSTWSMHNMSFTEVLALFCVSPRSSGGLGFSTTELGNVLAVSGVAVLLGQGLAFPPVVKRLGPIKTTRFSAMLAIPLLCVYPYLSGLHGVLLWAVIICITASKTFLAVATLSGSFMLINNSVISNERGRANGFSVTAVSLFKAIGPGAGGAIFAWGQSRQDSSLLPGNQMVFFILGVVVLMDVLFTFEPFLPKSVDKPIHQLTTRTAGK